MAFNIFSGENMLISAPLFAMGGNLVWQGPYDNTKAYVVNDVVLGTDLIGYQNILACTGVAPPHPANWTALPPLPAETIKRLLVELTTSGGRKVVVSWEYFWAGAPLSVGPLVLGATYIITHFGAGDVFTNVGAASSAQGVIFTATGTAPTTWTHGSILQAVTMPPNFSLQTGLFQAELLAADTVDLKGLYELRITLSTTSGTYIESGAQSDVLCYPDALNITPC
jgi:hypothetical protein